MKTKVDYDDAHFSTTAIAVALALGGAGFAGAQPVNPSQPGSAGGGLQAQSGQGSTDKVRDETRLTEHQVRNMLRDQGYSGGSTITAKAKRNDRAVRLRVDADTGVVSR